ncbi:LacI family DNA-binding transcriptional regulator [Cohnella zeiphila]|uniref:LacI family DNA-binding transcriptional regulator n=1 Tax=Cohnella zeiphila TaxID=2761120 RepID=A0A7X0SLQ4_9BACL|nr:LacI family DNA-binding transcriptional regulator [Cohnella zeiphila]MBB6732320.1 LacI family DNA-binding transcriptional regulator [Cohnella zeiphila]
MKMEDIARLAGVSKSAVSIAFSGKPGIGPETRERILKIAKDHGYMPKPRTHAAEAGSRTLTFLVFANSGIVLEQYYQQPFFRELIHYIEERCKFRGFSLLFSTIEMNKLGEQIRSIADEKRSDGVILLGTNLDRAQIAEIADLLPLPLVVLDNCYDTLPVHFVEINNMIGAYQAGSHLCRSGHTRIGYIASDVRIHNFEERRNGFAYALREHGVELAEDCTFTVAPTILSSQESLKRQLGEHLEAGKPLPSAFFCECDYIAISAIKTLTEMGYRIPEDVSVVGFDNISEASIVTPELTTVHTEKEQMAHLAVDLLVQSIASEDTVNTKVKVDTQLVERRSTRIVGDPLQ